MSTGVILALVAGGGVTAFCVGFIVTDRIDRRREEQGAARRSHRGLP